MQNKKYQLKGIIYLFKDSWFFYISRIKTILGIMIIPVLFTFLNNYIITFLEHSNLSYSIIFSFILALLTLINIFVWLLAIPALLICFKEEINIQDSYKKSFSIIVAYVWIYLLLSAIILGGFLLFVIPGILLFIWLSLTFFVFIFEEKGGFQALFQSKQLTRGFFWRIFLRFFLLCLIIGCMVFLLSFLVILVTQNQEIINYTINILAFLLPLFVLPFFFVYGFLIYKDVFKAKSEMIFQKPRKITKLKYAIPGFLGMTVIWFLLVFFTVNIFWGRDISPIDDSDLWLSKVDIPEKDNSFFILLDIEPDLSLLQEKGLSFSETKEWGPEVTSQIIEANQGVLDALDQALALSYFQEPELQDPAQIDYFTTMHGWQHIRRAVYIKQAKAYNLFSQGKDQEALDELIEIVEIGQMIQDAPRPNLLNYLTGLAIKEIGLKSLSEAILNVKLSPQLLKNYILELEKFKENEHGLAKAFKMEYVYFSNIKKIIDTGKLSEIKLEGLEKDYLSILDRKIRESKEITKSNYYYKPNQTQQMFAEYYRRLVNNAYKRYNEIDHEVEQFLLYSNEIMLLFTENLIGKILYDMSVVSLSGVIERKCSEEFLIKSNQLLFAIKAFYTETGEIITNLEQLVPEYFREIPKDPFDGDNIRYSSEEQKIYSPWSDFIFEIYFESL